MSPIDLIWIKFSNKFFRGKENYRSHIHNKVEVLEDNKTNIFLINWCNITLSFSLSIRDQAEMKTIITENSPNLSHGPQPCLTQWNYELLHIGQLKMDGSWWRVLTKHGPLEKGMRNYFSILALRASWTVWKGKKIEHCKMNSPDW